MKKITLLFLSVITLAILGLSGCTTAGMDLTFVGKWAGSYTVKNSATGDMNFNVTYEFKNDDTGSSETVIKVNGATYMTINSDLKVKKADSTNKTIEIESTSSGVSSTVKYKYTISSTELKLTQTDPAVVSGYPEEVTYTKK